MALALPAARFRKLFLLIGDLTVFVLGLLAALAVRYGFDRIDVEWQLHRLPFAILFVCWILVFAIGGLYDLSKAVNTRDFFTLFSELFTINAGLAVIFFYFVPYYEVTPKVVMFLVLGFTAVLLVLWRTFFHRLLLIPPLRLALIGAGPEVQEVKRNLAKHPQHGYECVLHLEQESELNGLPHRLQQKQVDVVAVALDYRNSPLLQKNLFACIPLHIQFFDFVDFYEQHFERIPLNVIDRAWFLVNFEESRKGLYSRLKRVIDILAVLVLSPVGILLSPFIAMAVWLDIGRPILFTQWRIGQFEKPFLIMKFRTFRHEGNEETVSVVGRFLRASHLDEIPQLWNILKGEMSFVGPRPEQLAMIEDFKADIPFYAERLLVRPGVTGWAQLHAPLAKAEDALEKLQYDLFYIKHRSLVLDLEIVLKTLRILLGS